MSNGIGWAVKEMWDGRKVRRSGWNGKGMWIALFKPTPATINEDEPHIDLPYVYMSTVTQARVPWLCSQTDLLATDWQLAE